MTFKEEKWLQHPVYTNYYFSNKGNVKRNDIILKTSLSGSNYDAYPRLTVSENSKKRTTLVHREVAKLFIPNPDNKPQVNHIDGNKKNNDVSNLEWVTASENAIHAFEVLGVVAHKTGKHKEFCPKGHSYSGNNLGITKTGWYFCKACRSVWDKRTKNKIKLARMNGEG